MQGFSGVPGLPIYSVFPAPTTPTTSYVLIYDNVPATKPESSVPSDLSLCSRMRHALAEKLTLFLHNLAWVSPALAAPILLGQLLRNLMQAPRNAQAPQNTSRAESTPLIRSESSLLKYPSLHEQFRVHYQTTNGVAIVRDKELRVRSDIYRHLIDALQDKECPVGEAVNMFETMFRLSTEEDLYRFIRSENIPIHCVSDDLVKELARRGIFLTLENGRIRMNAAETPVPRKQCRDYDTIQAELSAVWTVEDLTGIVYSYYRAPPFTLTVNGLSRDLEGPLPFAVPKLPNILCEVSNQNAVDVFNFTFQDFASAETADDPIGQVDMSGLQLGGLIWRNINFHVVNMQRIQMSEAEFSNVKFYAVDFSGANLARAKFKNCRFVHCNFFAVDFTGANFGGAKFNNCLFSHCNFGISGADSADFAEATFEDCSFLARNGAGAKKITSTKQFLLYAADAVAEPKIRCVVQ